MRNQKENEYSDDNTMPPPSPHVNDPNFGSIWPSYEKIAPINSPWKSIWGSGIEGENTTLVLPLFDLNTIKYSIVGNSKEFSDQLSGRKTCHGC